MADGVVKTSMQTIAAKLGQKGMDNVHTPAHYQTAFPGLALLGRIIIFRKELFTLSWDEILSSLYFPGFGGINLDVSLQKKHKEWDRLFYTETVRGTRFNDKWYALKEVDKHPWYTWFGNSIGEMNDEMSERDLICLCYSIWDLMNDKIPLEGYINRAGIAEKDVIEYRTKVFSKIRQGKKIEATLNIRAEGVQSNYRSNAEKFHKSKEEGKVKDYTEFEGKEGEPSISTSSSSISTVSVTPTTPAQTTLLSSVVTTASSSTTTSLPAGVTEKVIRDSEGRLMKADAARIADVTKGAISGYNSKGEIVTNTKSTNYNRDLFM